MERYNYEQDESYIKRLWEYIDKLEEENENLKKELHNTQLLLNAWIDDYIELKEENKKLENEINNSKSIWKIIENCVIFTFFCFMCAWCLCILFMMITDVVMWFQFVRYA